jgi:hypothetical protein
MDDLEATVCMFNADALHQIGVESSGFKTPASGGRLALTWETARWC